MKAFAVERQLPVLQPPKLGDAAVLDDLMAVHPDVLVVAAYGLILPATVLSLSPFGALNIHASLLPRWRGAAPIHRAILAGDQETGISIMQMDAGLDTGPVLERTTIAISANDTAGSLHDKLAALGADRLVHVLEEAQRGSLTPSPQSQEGVTYAQKIQKSEAAIDWRQPAVVLDRVVRAFNPAPGAHANFSGTEIKVWSAHPTEGNGAPGLVKAVGPDGVVVSSGKSSLVLTQLQRPGGKRLPAREFLRGFPISAGSHFALPA